MTDLHSFLKNMDNGTSSVSDSNSAKKPSHTPKREPTVLEQLKHDFAVSFSRLKALNVPVTETPCNVNNGLALKREGRYVEACRIYAAHAIDHEVFTPDLAMCWFKALASGGDILDALTVGDYLASLRPPKSYAADMLAAYTHGFRQMIEMDNEELIMQSLKAISGNPNYHIEKEDIDIYQNQED